MENLEKHFNEDVKVIYLFRREEYGQLPYACISFTNPGTPDQCYTILQDNQSKLSNCHQEYPRNNSTTYYYYENESKINNHVKFPSHYFKNQYETQPETYEYHSNFTNSNLIGQNWTLNEKSPTETSFTEHHAPDQTTVKQIYEIKSPYMDYLKRNIKKIAQESTRTRSRVYERKAQTVPIYKCKKHRDFEESYSTCDFMLDFHAPNRHCDQLDRRSRLCNYILNQSVNENYEDGSTNGNFSVTPHYTDVDNNLNGKTGMMKSDLPTNSYDDGEGLERKPDINSRYMDFYYKKHDESKDVATGKCCSETPNSNPIQYNCPNETVSVNDLNPICQTMVSEKPNVIKSRHMDLNGKDLSSGTPRKEPLKPSLLDWKDYHRLHTIHTFLNDMEYNYPSLCTTGVIGSSRENRDLKVLKVSNSDVGNASVWIDAGIHAREWIAPAVNTYIINHVVTNFNQLPISMQNKDWYFLPVMNPDGYEFSHTNYRMWRKNKACIDSECVGVDLNRNFSFGWGQKGSSNDPKSPFYHGPHPFSEPESRAVRDMLKSSGIHFKVYITLHSFGEAILFPFAYRAELCSDYIRLLEGSAVMSKAINTESGNIYKVGISRDVMNGAAGTSSDWCYGEAKIPFCYLLELRSKKHKFRLPQMEIEETGKEILSGIMALMEFVDDYDLDGRFIEDPASNKIN